MRKVDFDMCALGMTTPVTKLPLQKRTRLGTNLESVQAAFAARQCACMEYHFCDGKWKKHKTVQGCDHGIKISKHSQIYPPAMCELLARLIFEYCHQS